MTIIDRMKQYEAFVNSLQTKFVEQMTEEQIQQFKDENNRCYPLSEKWYDHAMERINNQDKYDLINETIDGNFWASMRLLKIGVDRDLIEQSPYKLKKQYAYEVANMRDYTLKDIQALVSSIQNINISSIKLTDK